MILKCYKNFLKNKKLNWYGKEKGYVVWKNRFKILNWRGEME